MYILILAGFVNVFTTLQFVVTSCRGKMRLVEFSELNFTH